MKQLVLLLRHQWLVHVSYHSLKAKLITLALSTKTLALIPKKAAMAR
jgi:hypothetical protein